MSKQFFSTLVEIVPDHIILTLSSNKIFNFILFRTYKKVHLDLIAGFRTDGIFRTFSENLFQFFSKIFEEMVTK